jgi:hypothetical protein
MASCEGKARNASRLGPSEAIASEPAGALASQYAEQYRRKHTQKRLYQILSSTNVRLALFNSESNGRFAIQSELLEATVRLDVERSLLLVQDHRERAEVLGPDLLTYLEAADAAWDVREETHDWLLVERLVRNFMAAQGCALPNSEIMSACEDLYSDARPTFPGLDRSEFARLVALLKSEYQDSDE